MHLISISRSQEVTPRIHHIDLAPSTNLYRPENVILYKLFHRNGYELRVAGVEVCDAILGSQSNFVEFVTSATAAQLRTMFELDQSPEISRVAEEQEKFNVVINLSVEFRITAFRMKTDPSGCQVNYPHPSDWQLHSAHNDFTVTSMLLDVDLSTLSGTDDGSNPTGFRAYVYDYYGGMEDLQDRRIRFAGDPAIRIREDPLRILQYFHLHGYLAPSNEPDVHDPATLKTISENVSGLGSVPGKHCWSLLKKILCYNSTPWLLRRMLQVGVFPYLSFYETPDFSEMDSAWQKGILSCKPNPVTCLATVVSTVRQAERLDTRLQLSTMERKILLYIIENRGQYAQLTDTNWMGRFQRDLLLSVDAQRGRWFVLKEMMIYLVYDSHRIAQWDSLKIPKFPVRILDLQTAWEVKRYKASTYLAVLRRQWVDSDCTWDKQKLLSNENRDIVRRIVTDTAEGSTS